jgi:hypothetical protein
MTGSEAALIWAGAIGGALGIALLRFAWSRKQRSHAFNAAGWALLLAGVWLGGAAAGAWGIAMVSLAAIGAACIALAIAGARSPPGRTKASSRRVGLLPEKGEPRRIGRRAVTFLLTIVGGFAVSVGLGLAVRGLGGLLGWSETNANVVALYTVPVAWSLLIFALLMQERRRSQIVTLAVCALPVLPVLISGAVQ